MTGLVTRAGRFEFPIAEEVRVLDAIALAGGTNSLGANKVYVIRRKPGTDLEPIDPQHPDRVKTFIIQTSLANAKQKAESNIRLQPGDVVSVEQTPLTFTLDLFKRIGMNVGGSFPLGRHTVVLTCSSRSRFTDGIGRLVCCFPLLVLFLPLVPAE